MKRLRRVAARTSAGSTTHLRLLLSRAVFNHRLLPLAQSLSREVLLYVNAYVAVVSRCG